MVKSGPMPSAAIIGLILSLCELYCVSFLQFLSHLSSLSHPLKIKNAPKNL